MVTVVGRLLQPRDSKLQNLPAGMLPEKNITANLVSISQENQKTCLERKIKYSKRILSVRTVSKVKIINATCAVSGSNFPLLSLKAEESPSANIRGWPLTRRVSSVSAWPLEFRERSSSWSTVSNWGSRGLDPTVHRTKSASTVWLFKPLSAGSNSSTNLSGSSWSASTLESSCEVSISPSLLIQRTK